MSRRAIPGFRLMPLFVFRSLGFSRPGWAFLINGPIIDVLEGVMEGGGGGSSSATLSMPEALREAKQLCEAGVLSHAEFNVAKGKILLDKGMGGPGALGEFRPGPIQNEMLLLRPEALTAA